MEKTSRKIKIKVNKQSRKQPNRNLNLGWGNSSDRQVGAGMRYGNGI